MGGVLVRDTIHDAFMTGPEHVVELTHGYTYSAHPLACAAGACHARHLPRRKAVRARQQARAEIRRRGDDAAQGEPNVVDIRTVGLTAGIDLAPRADAPGKRGFDGAQQRLPRQRPDAARRRRHAGADPAVDRQRGPDRRDRRQGRQGDPRDGLAASRNIRNQPAFIPRRRQSRLRRWRNCGHARAFEQPAARRHGIEAQPDQTGDAVLCARPDQPGDGNHHLLRRSRRAYSRPPAFF